MTTQPDYHPLRQKWIEELNRLMAEEVEAFLRYFQLRYRLRGADRLVADKFFAEAMQETLDHAEEIAAKLRALGVTPKLKVQVDLGGEPLRLNDALAEVLEFEQQALDAYRDLLPCVADNPGLEDFIRKQVGIETEHVQEIQNLLE